eukprot:gnl/TRDRNA2_/TRDRNA2_174544_c4_seq12.p1 gnl/TRDRNA2_/TRDRNA2_174544_c4~~gnl/TRDRNA2_/TRDRNA2_174544_c4_seq12.p1  ORF type:complete len:1012 (+),score=95.45 gnl/TRDRNA2_/TRDRNA2_174544_c4_seq12:85-3120(+)
MSAGKRRGSDDIIEFSTQNYYCTENEGSVILQVVRMGSCNGSASVKYSTVDASAVAGVKYAAQKGTLHFAPGETRKTIQIILLEDDCFDSTLEFEAHLSEPQGAMLGPYLFKCEVAIADNDTFPTNKFNKELTSSADARSLPKWPLLMEYFKMHLQDRRYRRDVFKNMLTDQILNLRFVWTALLMNYLVDHVLSKQKKGEPSLFVFLDPLPLGVRICSIIICFLLVHPAIMLANFCKARRRLAGRATMKLQQNLLRKFLHYNEASRKIVSTSDLTMAIMRDVPDLVRTGLLSLFPLVQKTGLLLILVVFSVFQARSLLNRVLAVCFVLTFFVVMAVFVSLRRNGTIARNNALHESETEIASFVLEMVDNFSLVADYHQVQESVKDFGQLVQNLNESLTAVMTWRATSENFAPALTGVFVSIYILLSFQSVIDGDVPAGEFLTGIGIWLLVGSSYRDIYAEVIALEDTFAPLCNIVFYMNLPTDTEDRMRLGRMQLSALQEAQDSAQAFLFGDSCLPPDTLSSLIQKDVIISTRDSCVKAAYAQDLMQIDAANIHFSYPVRDDNLDGEKITVLRDANFEFTQGQLVAVIGPRGGGKGTLLKMLGKVLVPEKGFLFTPPHLRVLHVSFEPQFLHLRSLQENLCYGPSDGADETPERVMSICKRLGVSDQLLQQIDREFAVESRDAGRANAKQVQGTPMSASRRLEAQRSEIQKRFSYSDRCLIHIARALIMNPEVLVIHKPLAHFNALTASRILSLLREFVSNRGVEKSTEERRHLHPRTCIFSSVNLEGVELADQAFRISDGSIQPMDMVMLKKLESQARELFAILDEDGDEKVTRREFVQRGLRMPTGFWSSFLKVSDEKLYRDPGFLRESLEVAFDVLDVDNSDEICFDELRHFMLHKISGACPTTASTNTQAELGSVTLQISEEPLPPLAFEVVGSRVGRSRKSRWGKRWRRRTRRRWKRRRRELEGFGTGTPTPSNQLQSGGDYNPLPTASTSRKKQPQEPRHVRFLL